MLTMNDYRVDEFKETLPARQAEPERVACRVPRILLGEDDVEMRTILATALRRDGYEVVEVGDGVHLLHRLVYSTFFFGNRSGFDLIISDVRMPELSGLGVLAWLRHDDAAPPVILITAFGDQKTHAEAKRLGAIALFDKPFAVDDLRATVRDALAA